MWVALGVGVVNKMNKFDEVLKSESYDDVDTLYHLLKNITTKYNVRINLADVAGISKIDSRIDDIFDHYGYHNNCFCNSVKKNKINFRLCVKSKSKLCKALSRIKTPFYGRCYMGVNEIYYPVRFNDKLIALICIGQFTDNMENSIEFVQRKARRYGLDPVIYAQKYASIVKDIDFSIEDLNKDVWSVCNYISMLYKNRILQNSINSELSNAMNLTADYYQNKYIVSSAMDFIKKNYSSKLSLDFISKHCYCNSAYLSYLFKKETGISITDYINRCRVEHAKHLLDVTNLTITQISGAVGFNDPSYFSKMFKKLQGVYPTHYRNRNI